MMHDSWASDGLPDDLASERLVPAEIEVAPGVWRSVGECSADELAAAADARRLDARAADSEADALVRLAALKAGIERIEAARAQVIRHVEEQAGPIPSEAPLPNRGSI